MPRKDRLVGPNPAGRSPSRAARRVLERGLTPPVRGADRRLRRLSEISRHGHPGLAGVLATAREELGMDLAYVARLADGRQVYEALEGDAAAFGLYPGASVPPGKGFCELMVDGRAPQVIPDTSAEPAVQNLAATTLIGIGAYVGVPLRFSDGRLYGTLCCLSRTPDRSLDESDSCFLHVLARLVAEQLERDELENDKRRRQIQTAAGITVLLTALETRDHYTGSHIETVVDLALRVASRLCLTPGQRGEVEQTAMLHDIGKVGISDAILQKPGPLTGTEWDVVRRHPVIGQRIIASIPSLAHLAPAIRAEHERWDGHGYPDRLSGDQVPLASQIVFACNAYAAMTSDRPYRRSMSAAAAREELARHSGTQFSPDVIRGLLDVTGAVPQEATPHERTDIAPDKSGSHGLVTQARTEAGNAQASQNGSHVHRSRSLPRGVLSGLIRSLDNRDPRMGRHAAGVARFARDIAQAIDASEQERELTHIAGLLHDIGHFALSDRVHERGRTLTDEDWIAIWRHPKLGAEMIKDLGVGGPVAEIVLAHHERVDGRGYPHGRGSDEIPEIAKIVAVAEVYDTLTASDTYRTRMSSFEALRELRRVSGTQLDGRYVEVLAGLLTGESVEYRHADAADFDAELKRQGSV